MLAYLLSVNILYRFKEAFKNSNKISISKFENNLMDRHATEIVDWTLKPVLHIRIVDGVDAYGEK